MAAPWPPQLIGDDPPRGVRQALQPLPEDSLRRLLVSPALHQHVEDIPLLVHGSPQIVPCAMDGQKHLIQVPRIARPRVPAALLMGIGRPTFPPPRPPRVVGESDAACGPAPFDIPTAQAEAEVAPYPVATNLGWEAMAFAGIGAKSFGHTASRPHKAGAEAVANLL